MNLRNLDSTLVFFVLIFVLFWFWFPCFVVTHLSTSSNWQTEVQDKTLLAWSWHVLCTVESLDLAMLDDHPSPRTCGQGAPARWVEGVGENSLLWAPPSCLPCHWWWPGPALALLAGSPLAICARAPPPEPLGHNCHLFSPSSQLTEWLPLVIQILET